MSPTNTSLRQHTIDIDPWDIEVLQDASAFHRELRDTAPVVYLKKYNVYAMGRYEQVRAALANWQDFESKSGVGLSNWRYEKPWRPLSVVNEADPPHHDAPRHAIMKILTPRAIGALGKSWESDAGELVDQLLGTTTEFDLIADLAEKFPIRVFPDALGLPQEGRENLIPYSEYTFNSFGPANELVTKKAKEIPAIAAWVNEQCHREVLSTDGFGAQLWEAADRGEITYEQVPLLIRSLITAGVDTTVIGLGLVLTSLAHRPDLWQRLRENPQLIRRAFDEAIRLESPVQTLFRTASRDMEVEGIFIPEGSKVYLSVAAANRDPRRWENPDSFDLDRDPSGHLGFGMGLHQCVGQHLARMEADALLGALVKKVERIEICGPTERHLHNTLRSWESVPVRVHLA